MDEYAVAERLREAQQSIQIGLYDHAMNLLTVILAGDPDNAEAWSLLARATGDQSLRRRALLNVVRLRPDDAQAWRRFNNLGVREATTEFRPLDYDPPTAGGQAPPMFIRGSTSPLPPRLPDLRRRHGGQGPTKAGSWFVWAMAAVATFGVFGCGLFLCAAALVGTTLGGQFRGIALSQPVGVGRPGALPVPIKNRLAYNQWARGQLDTAGGCDGYDFMGRAGETVSVEVAAAEAMSLRPAIGLYGPDLTQLIHAESGENVTARLSVMLTVTGQYVIVVTGQNSTTGAYRVMLWQPT